MAMIELVPGCKVIGIWFVGWESFDWLCGAWRDIDGIVKIRYRWRRYADDKVFNSKDEKSGEAFEMDPDNPNGEPGRVIADLDRVVQRMVKGDGTPGFIPPKLVDAYTPGAGEPEDATNWLMERPWTGTRHVVASPKVDGN